jgi:hypothetical protein
MRRHGQTSSGAGLGLRGRRERIHGGQRWGAWRDGGFGRVVKCSDGLLRSPPQGGTRSCGGAAERRWRQGWRWWWWFGSVASRREAPTSEVIRRAARIGQWGRRRRRLRCGERLASVVARRSGCARGHCPALRRRLRVATPHADLTRNEHDDGEHVDHRAHEQPHGRRPSPRDEASEKLDHALHSTRALSVVEDPSGRLHRGRISSPGASDLAPPRA